MPHIHKLYDFVVNAYIVYEEKVLLVNHPRYGLWLPVGGHVELDEHPLQTLKREVKEEAGLEVEPLNQSPPIASDGYLALPTPNYLDVHEANPPHQHIALIYFCKSKTNKAVRSAEHSDLRWFSLKDLDNPKYQLNQAIKFYAKQALTTG